MFTKRIHVFKAGDQTSAQGVSRSFSPKDLDQVVQSYDPQVHEAPLVLGHQGDSDSLPSFGWIKGFERVGDNLYANVAFTDVAKDLVKDGHYRKCSISFYSPDSQINPHPGKWTARHLALLGAAPPAVKGLEPFNFAEWDSRVGVYDFAVTLSPEQVFDEDLGPTLIRELSPLEMLKEKLDLARSEMMEAVDQVTGGGMDKEQAVEDVDQEVEEQEEQESEIASPDNPENYSERPRRGDNARSIADLEDQFPQDEFMEEGISRKKKSTPHGSVSQIVENVYKESTAERKEAADRSAEAKRQRKEGRFGAAHETEEIMKMKDKELSTDHEEMGADNPKMRNPRMQPGKVDYGENHGGSWNSHGPHGRGVGEDRYETAKSSEQMEDRYKVGKTTPEKATFGRYDLKKGKEQHDAGRPAAKNNGIEEDRVKKGQYTDPDDKGRYTDEEMDQVYNGDQYDEDVDYGVNNAKTASGSNPAGREDSETKVPTETEEMPDDEIFGVNVEDVKRAKNARVMYIKGGEKMPKSFGGGIPGSVMADYAEPEPAEITGKDGVYREPNKRILSGEFEGGPNEETLRSGGVYSESYRGEPKSNKKALTPGEFDSDEDDEPAERTGPSGVTGGADHGEPTAERKAAADRSAEARRQEREGHPEKAAVTRKIMKVEDEALSDDHKESTAERKAAADRSAEARRQEREGHPRKAAVTRKIMKVEDEALSDDHGELPPALKAQRDKVKEQGHFAEEHAEGLEAQAGIPRSKKDMLSGEFEGGVGEETGPSGVDAGYAEHKKSDNPYSRTGFGSTYKEDEDMDDEYCDMGGKKPMGRNYKEADEFAEFRAELEALKAENARIKHEYREAQIAHRREQIHSFVEGLYERGQMVDSIIPQGKLVEFAEGLEFGVLEFAEGETATGLLFSILDNLPNLVDFSEYAGGSMKFVDEVDLDPHQKALAMVEKSGGELDYVEALKKAMYS